MSTASPEMLSSSSSIAGMVARRGAYEQRAAARRSSHESLARRETRGAHEKRAVAFGGVGIVGATE